MNSRRHRMFGVAIWIASAAIIVAVIFIVLLMLAVGGGRISKERGSWIVGIAFILLLLPFFTIPAGNNLLRRLLLAHYCPRLGGELVIPPVAHMTSRSKPRPKPVPAFAASLNSERDSSLSVAPPGRWFCTISSSVLRPMIRTPSIVPPAISAEQKR